MAASREDVDRWISTAKEKKVPFLLSVCDTYDWEDYPVYCESGEDLKSQYDLHHGKNMQRVNEIIVLKVDGIVVENIQSVELAMETYGMKEGAYEISLLLSSEVAPISSVPYTHVSLHKNKKDALLEVIGAAIDVFYNKEHDIIPLNKIIINKIKKI